MGLQHCVLYVAFQGSFSASEDSRKHVCVVYQITAQSTSYSMESSHAQLLNVNCNPRSIRRGFDDVISKYARARACTAPRWRMAAQEVPDFPPIPKITTDEIGQLLDEKYNDDGNESIDYFYLQIRKRFVDKRKEKDARMKITRAITKRPEEWRKVAPGLDWPSIFFAKFEKLPAETEREQEQRLNSGVRQALKRTLEDELVEFANPDVPQTPVVHIMLTRVCKYTNPTDDFMEAEDYNWF